MMSAPPPLEIERYFVGRTEAFGVFIDRFGRLRRRFEVVIEGSWDGRELLMVEDFVYDSGETERRNWRIRKTGTDAYEGEAEGVIGAAFGRQLGSAVNWRYRFALRVGGRVLNVAFDDWLFAMSDEVVINRARVRKYGFLLGDVILSFRRVSGAAPSAA